jgi:hypothetical protein
MDTPIGSTELGVSVIIHISAKGNSQHYKLGKQKPRFTDVQSYSMKGSEPYCSGYRITAILTDVSLADNSGEKAAILARKNS